MLLISFQSEYLVPLWYPEEIENAVRSLSVAVVVTYYGGCSLIDQKLIQRVRDDKKLKKHKKRHTLAQQHDPIHCQACHDGLCVISGFFY